MRSIVGRLSSIDTIHANLSAEGSISASIIIPKELSVPYEGEYVITPTAQEQVLDTKNFVMLNNVIINPIPSNYGLITWDGATLTVS